MLFNTFEYLQSQGHPRFIAQCTEQWVNAKRTFIIFCLPVCVQNQNIKLCIIFDLLNGIQYFKQILSLSLTALRIFPRVNCHLFLVYGASQYHKLPRPYDQLWIMSPDSFSSSLYYSHRSVGIPEPCLQSSILLCMLTLLLAVVGFLGWGIAASTNVSFAGKSSELSLFPTIQEFTFHEAKPHFLKIPYMDA